MKKESLIEMQSMRRTLLAAAIAGACTIPANAQWTIINLNPAGSIESDAFGVGGNQQVGVARVNGVYRASLWSGSANSWVDLSPASAVRSEAHGAGGGQQVGWVLISGVYYASLWTGTSGSWVSLKPTSATEAYAYDCDGAEQVGKSKVSGSDRASLWRGTANSWVNLNPSTAEWSVAWSVDVGTQAGTAYVNGRTRASLWSETANSWINLHPAAGDWSEAFGVQGGHQAGYASIGGNSHASLWSGTADSWVDLHPSAALSSMALDVDGDFQVGWALVDGTLRASFWNGSAASWVDLHALLPAEYGECQAYGIWSDANDIYIVGYAWNTITSRNEALMWVGPSGAGVTLTADGTCPGGGAISVSWTGATHGGRVGLLYANTTGSFVIPPGHPCAGTVTGLGSNGIQLVFSGGAGANGSRTVNGTAPGGACGRFLQLLDVPTCGTSNVATIN